MQLDQEAPLRKVKGCFNYDPEHEKWKIVIKKLNTTEEAFAKLREIKQFGYTFEYGMKLLHLCNLIRIAGLRKIKGKLEYFLDQVTTFGRTLRRPYIEG